jgi:hypothetical protein
MGIQTSVEKRMGKVPKKFSANKPFLFENCLCEKSGEIGEGSL